MERCIKFQTNGIFFLMNVCLLTFIDLFLPLSRRLFPGKLREYLSRNDRPKIGQLFPNKGTEFDNSFLIYEETDSGDET